MLMKNQEVDISKEREANGWETVPEYESIREQEKVLEMEVCFS